MKKRSISVFSEHPYGSPDLNALETTARRVLQNEGWSFNLKIVVVDDAEIRRLHRLFLGAADNTDVIAFPEDDGEAAEVYLNLDQARLQALEASESVLRALQRLLIHGILHLGGWSDADDIHRQKMLLYGEQYLIND